MEKISSNRSFWVRFGEFIARIIAPIVMALIFFMVLTPIGVFLRLIGKDLLNIKFNKSNLYEWMNLTKKERFDLSKNESYSYSKKRKTLLEEIRKEYKSISKNDQTSL